MATLLAAGLLSPAFAGGDPTAGAAAYKAKRCAMCHQIAGQGGKSGPALDDTGAKHDAAWLRQLVKDPKAVNPKSRMMAYPGISDKDLDDLVAYLTTLKTAPPRK